MGLTAINVVVTRAVHSDYGSVRNMAKATCESVAITRTVGF
jgi:hypothetical protein